MRFIAILIGLGLLTSCQQSRTKQTPAGNGPSFVFSAQSPSAEICQLRHMEAVVINADPANANRRIFYLGEKLHHVTVKSGKLTASLALLKTGANVEILTSDNGPECLSNRNNFTLLAEGHTFRYDNQMTVDFEMSLLPVANGLQVALDMPAGAGYGITVSK